MSGSYTLRLVLSETILLLIDDILKFILSPSGHNRENVGAAE